MKWAAFYIFSDSCVNRKNVMEDTAISNLCCEVPVKINPEDRNLFATKNLDGYEEAKRLRQSPV
jgi:hypothetical protein